MTDTKTYGGKTLEELETLERGATEGPWEKYVANNGSKTRVRQVPNPEESQVYKGFRIPGSLPSDIVGPQDWGWVRPQDAALIAAARNALPEMIAHIRKLEQDNYAKYLLIAESIIRSEETNRELQELRDRVRQWRIEFEVQS